MLAPMTSSIVAHTLLIAASVIGTLPVASLAADSIANRIFYIPPPNKPPAVAGSVEVIHYVNVAQGIGVGPGPEVVDASKPIGPPLRSAVAGPQPNDSAPTTQPPGNSTTDQDSVYTIVEVDSAVVRSSASAAPAYPLDLLKQQIEGSVRVRYVVDTTGLADPASLEILEATRPEFAASVRDVLPFMRFSPAKIGSRKVRQLVEQPFAFHIAKQVPAAVVRNGKPR
jgi:protein TonB